MKNSKQQFHYGWIICFCGALMTFCAMGLSMSAFSLFLPYMAEAAGISDTNISELLTIRSLFGVIGVALCSAYYRKLSLRKGLTLSLLTDMVSILLYARFHSFPGYAFGMALTGLSYALGTYVPVALLIENWFCRHRGLAIGIGFSGSGIAAILMTPLITAVIEKNSLSAGFTLVAVIIAVSAALIFLLVRDDPSELGLHRFGEEENPASAAAETNVQEPEKKDAAAGMRENGKEEDIPESGRRNTVSLVLLAVAMFFTGAVSISAFSPLSMVFSSAGISPMRISYMLSMGGIAIFITKISVGASFDRFGIRGTVLLYYLMLTVGLVVCASVYYISYPVALGNMLILQAGNSICTVGVPIYVKRVSPGKRYASDLKNEQLVYNIGGLVTGTMPGLLADLSGSYFLPYLLFAAMSLLSMFFILAAVRHAERKVPA